MAAVEHAMLGNEQLTERERERERDRDQPATNGSFTAVNGSGSTPTRTTSFRPEHAVSVGGYHQHSLPRQNPASDQNSDRREVPDNALKEPGTGYPQRSEQQSYTRLHASAPTSESVLSPNQQHNLGKRKRSVDAPTRSSSERFLSQASPPSTKETNERESTKCGRSDHPQSRPYSNSESHIHRRHNTWSDVGLEDHLAESLQKDIHTRDTHSHEDDSDSPTNAIQHSDNGSQTNQDGISHDGKKQTIRKRNFSQRTKTGCHTCRERKKKCDEAKPVCNNCTRGNFACKGYGPKSELDVRSSKPPPLQSKSVQNLRHPGHYPLVNTPTYQLYSSPSRIPTENWINGQASALPPLERNRPPLYDPSTAYSLSSWPRPGGNEHEHEALYPHDHFSSSSYNRMPHSDRNGPPPRYSSAFAPTVLASDSGDSTRSAMTAQLAPHHPATLARLTEKEKMLIGKPYRHFIDEQLINERNDCRASLERFNNACRPSAGASPEERGRLFRAIVQPDRLMRNSGPKDPVGSCGSRVIVEAPFTCEYGYNINIGDDVVVQAGCVVLDPCKIIIGSRTVVGPGVKFYGLTVPMDPKQRSGSQGLVYGGSITIEEDCFIGGDVIILPNRTINRGSVVGAGTVVSKDVQPNTVVAGNPMRVVRGIGPAADDLHTPQIQTENDTSISIMLADRYGNRDGKPPSGR